MKQFKFKLDGLLKLREFKEKKVKTELGIILKEINSTEDRIKKLHQDIDDAYKSQEALASTPTEGRMMQFYPHYIKGLKEDINSNETLLYSLKRKYEQKLKDLNTARGEVKVIENLKEKKVNEHKRIVNKKEQEKIEDIINMRRKKAY